RRDSPRARRLGAERQGALSRREQLRGLSFGRQPMDFEERAFASLRWIADAVLAGHARSRARARSALPALRARHFALVATRGRFSVGQIPEGPSAAGGGAARQMERTICELRHTAK